MKHLVFSLLFLFIFFLLPRSALATLYINEFSSGTSDSDWMEIYNSGSDSVDLSLYRVRDNTATNKIDLDGIIDAGGFKVFEWSNKLNNSGDIIKLVTESDESIIDQIGYGSEGSLIAPQGSETAGRISDGSSSWAILSSSTKGSSNNTSTPVPTATPIPIDIPTPTNSPTPTKTPTPIKTPTPTPKPTSTPTPTQPFSTSTKTPTKSPAPTPESDKDKNEISPTVSQNEKSETTVLGEKDEKTKKNPETKTGKKGIFQNFFGIGFFAGGLILLICGILFYFKTKEKNENFE